MNTNQLPTVYNTYCGSTLKIMQTYTYVKGGCIDIWTHSTLWSLYQTAEVAESCVLPVICITSYIERDGRGAATWTCQGHESTPASSTKNLRGSPWQPKTVAQTLSAAGHTIRFAWQTRELCVIDRTVAYKHIAYMIEMFCRYMIFNTSYFNYNLCL